MKRETITIKAADFNYPSKAERKKAFEEYPKIENFQFAFTNPIQQIFENENKDIKKLALDNQLYFWNNCLSNRFGKIHETYASLKTHYSRGFSESHLECSTSEIPNRLLFDYYAEIFYYFFFSARDILAQLLNIYYRLEIEENKLRVDNNFINKLKVKNLKAAQALNNFFTTTKRASDIRNSFAHRFTPNYNDNRPTYDIKNGKETYGAGLGATISSKEILSNIEESLNHIKLLMDELISLVK